MVCRRTSALSAPVTVLVEGNHRHRPRGVLRQIHQQTRRLVPATMQLQISPPRDFECPAYAAVRQSLADVATGYKLRAPRPSAEHAPGRGA
jgi:hypothetical protein